MKSNCRILVVDDEDNVRKMLRAVLSRDGYTVETAEDGSKALASFTAEMPDIVLMDIRMPGLNGLEVLQQMRALRADATIILMTAFASVETAVEALRQGAFDYIIKPFDLDEVKILLRRALEMRRMRQEIDMLHRELSSSFQWGHFLTNNPAMMELCRGTARIALTNAAVLLTGESGTGKELIAKAIHYNSQRSRGPFIKVNCGALSETLLESELFGHEKGAFTGALDRKLGLFERADQGTLLLDEVGEMSTNLQVKVLRVLQEREFERIGGSQTIKTDFRMIAATNRNLAQMVEQKAFREDLYYRLNVIHLKTLPLRERPEDIELLANHFLQRFCAENGKDIVGIDSSALEVMQAYSWPGNVRELANAMEHAVIMSLGIAIFVEDLPEHVSAGRSGGGDEPEREHGQSLKDRLKDYEREQIRKVLHKHGGSRIKAVQELGISRRSLMYKLQEYHLE